MHGQQTSSEKSPDPTKTHKQIKTPVGPIPGSERDHQQNGPIVELLKPSTKTMPSLQKKQIQTIV